MHTQTSDNVRIGDFLFEVDGKSARNKGVKELAKMLIGKE